MTWLLTIISLIGNWLNCRRLRSGFIVWIICNTGWFIWDLMNGVYARCVLDTVQTAFCVYGIIHWSK